jgi:hypothetical protein
MSPSHGDSGWCMVVLLGCFAIALSFVTLGLGAINLAEPPPADRPQSPTDDSDRTREAVEEMRAKVARAAAEVQGIEKANKEKQVVAARQHEQEREAAAESDVMGQEADDLRGKIRDAERRADSLRTKIAESQRVRVDQLYGRAGTGLNPQWVECVADAVILQPQGTQVGLDALKGNSGDAFVQAIRKTGYAAFLVRPKGFESFLAARSLANKQDGVKVGFEPVDEHWDLAFTGGQP